MDISRSSLELAMLDGPLERNAAARILGGFYMAGSAMGLAALFAARPGADVAGLATVEAAACAIGLALVVGAGRLPALVVPLGVGLAVPLTAAAVHFDGDGASAYGTGFIGIALIAGFFLPRVQALAVLALAGGAYAGVVAAMPGPGSVQMPVMVLGIAAIGGLVVSYMRERVRELFNRLIDAARTDPLTGLLNRRALEELFELELERSRRSERPLSVIVGDLDGFKAVNDRHGHHAGDEALQTLAEELGKWKRRIDMAARIGGEEFALLLPETDERGAFLVAERLRRATQRTFADGPHPLTISFGVATFPVHGEDADMVLRAADQALYAAKDLGKDRSVIYSEELSRRVLEAGGEADHDLSELRLAAVVSLAEALDIRDTGTADHAHAVGRYAQMMALELGLGTERSERVRLAGVLHDIGKLGVTTPADEHDGPEMRTHPEIAASMLGRPEFDDLREWILYHHERVDGRGYPRGLSGAEIPLESRILAVADAYEAMTAGRVHRASLGDQAARVELVAGSGAQFDGGVVEAFLSALDRAAESALDSPEPTVTK
jgi:diguanylate cyclase (GGDEF)-like protein/putative nucleotidyltransferase with HDIG domain